MGKRCEVPVNDRREAVLSLLRKEETAAAIARRYCVSEKTTSDCPSRHTSASIVEAPSLALLEASASLD
jgi:hypothetical protein